MEGHGKTEHVEGRRLNRLQKGLSLCRWGPLPGSKLVTLTPSVLWAPMNVREETCKQESLSWDRLHCDRGLWQGLRVISRARPGGGRQIQGVGHPGKKAL